MYKYSDLCNSRYNPGGGGGGGLDSLTVASDGDLTGSISST